MQKDVGQPFNNLKDVSVSGTTTYYSAISNILHKDSVGIELSWTGSPVGTFSVWVSNSYKPALAQSEGNGPPSSGNWAQVPLTNPVTGVTALVASTGAGSPIFLNLNQLGSAWIQVTYTNASSTGVINSVITSKSLG